MDNAISFEAKKCKTCRYWDAPLGGEITAPCRSPGDHRYWKVPMTDKKTGTVSYAMLDSFGPEKTRHDEACGAWKPKP